MKAPGVKRAKKLRISSIFQNLGRDMPREERLRLARQLFPKRSERFVTLRRFFVLLAFSVGIATLGLLQNSAAVVIGAMLISPLMTPILAAASSIALGRPDRLFQAALQLLAATLFCVLAAYIVAQLTHLPQNAPIPEQALARARPNVYDLIVGLLAGAAGAFVMVRSEAVSAVPGVAIAVALVPPLASVGVLLYLGAPVLAGRAMLLYAANLAAILMAGSLTFLIMGLTPGISLERFGRRILMGAAFAALLVVLIAWPLLGLTSRVIQQVVDRNTITEEVVEWVGKRDMGIDEIWLSKDIVVVSIDAATSLGDETAEDDPTGRTNHFIRGLGVKELADSLGARLAHRRKVLVVVRPVFYASTCGNREECGLAVRLMLNAD